MKESHNTLGVGAFGPEPDRDVRLGMLLRDVVGPTPYDAVQWDALADRIGASVAAQRSVPWWSYAARWERRAISMALAAGVAAAFALLTAGEAAPPLMPTTPAAEAVTAVISGAPVEDAASSFAHYVTGTADFNVGVRE
jgi:hypothetical protein